MTNPTLSAVKSSFGSFYRDEGQGMKDVDKQFLIKAATDQFFNLKPTKNTEERRIKVNIADPVYQKFQKVLSSSGSFTLLPRSISMQDAKYEVSLADMDDLENSWVGFLADNDGNDRAKWPFIQFIVNQMMLEKGREDFELNEVYAGAYTTITTPGTANAAGLNFVGIKKLLQDFSNASSSNVVPIGTLETDPQAFYEQINAWVASSMEADARHRMIIQNMCDGLAMAPELCDRYGEGKDKALNTNYMRDRSVDQNVLTRVLVPRTSGLYVTGLPSMTGDEGMFMTLSANRAAFIKRPRGEQEFGVFMSSPYNPVLFAKFWKGIGFWHPEYVWQTEAYD
jgi:hypothetical protein